MSNSESFILGDVLDLSNKPLVKENFDISLDIKNILKDYIKDELLVTNKKQIEKILLEMSSDLQKEESISTILLAMKSSQTVNFLNINKPVLGSRSQSVKPEVGNEGIKSDEFHLTAEMSRKILDHQFVTRQKMINSQLEKALYEIPMKRNQTYCSQEFIPNTNNQEFIALVGFSEVVDVLKQEQQRQNADFIEEKNCVDCTNICAQCGTDASPMFKKRKTSNASEEETICSTCNNDVIHCQSRKELEEQIAKLKLQFEEQEKNLIRDYNDMLSSPKKLEMFRVEQEKRHRVQRIGNSGSNKPNNNNNSSNNNNNRQSISSSQNLKTNNNNNKPPNFNLQSNNNNNGSSSNNPMQSNKIPAKPQPIKSDQSAIRPCNNSDPNQAHLTYLHFLQAFAMQASNSPQQNIDQENLKKLEQIIATFQSNPMLASNNMTVLQLLANLSNQDSNTNNNNSNNNSVNSSNNSANNAHLMNLLSYFVNLMQTQHNQNVV